MGSDRLEITYSQQFQEMFPHYLNMGMTYEMYWDMDCCLVIAYRQAYKLKQEHENRLAWQQGMYIYDALCCVSPVLNAFAKNGTKPHPYPECPYGEKAETSQEIDAEELERREQLKAKLWMNDLVRKFKVPNRADKE